MIDVALLALCAIIPFLIVTVIVWTDPARKRKKAEEAERLRRLQKRRAILEKLAREEAERKRLRNTSV